MLQTCFVSHENWPLNNTCWCVQFEIHLNTKIATCKQAGRFSDARYNRERKT